MKRRFGKVSLVVAFVICAGMVLAETVKDDTDFRAAVRLHQATSVESGASLDIESGGTLKIAGSNVTATAAQLNLAGGGSAATLTPTLVSNATLKVYGSNLVIKAGGTVDLPAASVASTALAASITDSTLFSNNTAKVYASNLVVKAGGTVTVPDGSVGVAALGTGGVIPANSMASLTNAAVTLFTGKTLSFITLTNVIYGGGATTADVNVVRWQ